MSSVRVPFGHAGGPPLPDVKAGTQSCICPVAPSQRLGLASPSPRSCNSHRYPTPACLSLCCAVGPAAMGPSSSGGLLGMLLGGSMMSGGGSYRGQEPVLSGNYAFDMSFPFSL